VQFPKELERNLFNKLRKEVFDMGLKVKIMVNEEEGQTELHSTQPMKKSEDVYLIDHAWSFKLRQAEQTLREHEKLRQRMVKVV